MKQESKNYTKKILADHNCDEYAYGGVDGETIISDLKSAYPDGMEYPYIDVANAIVSISKVRPINRAPWKMLFDMESACDSIDFESFGAAKCDAEDALINWMVWERHEWSDVFNPTEDELDSYNMMIYNCSVEVLKYNPDTDEYEKYWSPSYEDEEQLGWKELTREDLVREKAACAAGLVDAGTD